MNIFYQSSPLKLFGRFRPLFSRLLMLIVARAFSLPLRSLSCEKMLVKKWEKRASQSLISINEERLRSNGGRRDRRRRHETEGPPTGTNRVRHQRTGGVTSIHSIPRIGVKRGTNSAFSFFSPLALAGEKVFFWYVILPSH